MTIWSDFGSGAFLVEDALNLKWICDKIWRPNSPIKTMSPETPKRRRLSKGTRKFIRDLKSQARREMGITQPQPDSVGKENLDKFLRLKLGSQYERFVPHFSTLWEFCQIREQIKTEGFRKDLVASFQTKHGNDLICELTPALTAVLEYVGKKK